MPPQLIHEIIPVGLLQCNCSILGDPATGDAIVIDPGDNVDRILEILQRNKLKVRAIVSTHTHIDHVGGLPALHRATGAPVMIHEDDLWLYRELDKQAEMIGIPAPESMQIKDFIREGDKLRWGAYEAEVLHTPGHTPGSISLVIGETSNRAKDHHATSTESVPIPRLIAGDTLFQGSIGRTDFPGGSYPQIINSIREKLLTLPDELLVVPGHGDNTTIGEEREYNPFLR
jgi:glyoxylase-like metal-dependent hydrolase (beta-lactamase superfamily II)